MSKSFSDLSVLPALLTPLLGCLSAFLKLLSKYPTEMASPAPWYFQYNSVMSSLGLHAWTPLPRAWPQETFLSLGGRWPNPFPASFLIQLGLHGWSGQVQLPTVIYLLLYPNTLKLHKLWIAGYIGWDNPFKLFHRLQIPLGGHALRTLLVLFHSASGLSLKVSSPWMQDLAPTFHFLVLFFSWNCLLFYILLPTCSFSL